MNKVSIDTISAGIENIINKFTDTANQLNNLNVRMVCLNNIHQLDRAITDFLITQQELLESKSNQNNAELYPHYFKNVDHLNEIDVYRVCKLFGIKDESGAKHHAIKKLLVSGNRGVKDDLQDIIEARNTLNRLITIMEEDANEYI